MTRIMSLIACAVLIVGAVAVPVAANHEGEKHERPSQSDERKGSSDERKGGSDKGAEGNDTRDERKDARKEAAEARKAAAHERRDAMKQEIADRKAAFHEAREACKAAFKAGNGTENGTAGPGRCISMAAHDKHNKTVRAEHYHDKHVAAVEKRLAKLDDKADRVQERIDSGELNETAMADAEAKLERIQAAQERLEAKLAAWQERLEALRDEVEPEPEDPESESPEPTGNATGNGTAAA